MADIERSSDLIRFDITRGVDMRKQVTTLLAAALIIALAACSKRQEAPESVAADAAAPQSATVEMAKEAQPDMASDAAAAVDKAEVSELDGVPMQAPVSNDQLSSTAATYVDNERKFVRTANAQFRVQDVYQSAMNIENVVASQGGFVVKNDITSQTQRQRRFPKTKTTMVEFTEYVVQGQLTVRVPSEKTQDFLRAIANQMQYLDHRNFAANDVQFELLRQKLEYQRSQDAQKQLGDISQAPGRVADRAEVVQSQLSTKAERDEAIVQRKEKEDKVSFSTIDLSLYQAAKVQQAEVPNIDAMIEANSPGFFAQLWDAMSDGWKGFLTLIIMLSYAWPLWLLLAVGVYGIRRWVKRKKV
jgi:hypothetical protein